MRNYRNDILKAIADSDKPFVGVRLDENKLNIFQEICRLADEVSEYKDPFFDITAQYPTEFPNDHRNAIAFLNVLTPVNINAKPVMKAISKMIDLADNFMITFLESEGHKIARFGFGVRDIWVGKDNL